MSRNATLYARLDQLETAFAERLLVEFAKAYVNTLESNYLYFQVETRRHPSDHQIIRDDDLNKIEKDILEVRRSVGADPLGPVVTILRGWADAMEAGGFLQNKMLCQDAMDKLKETRKTIQSGPRD